ncbi:hypothetical protein GW943_03345 [Candidatus Parcubacteria bacterium]|uniref:Uncharacterized protein n=1 Tax=Candidatus Kaiserbacteria bacterium CG10_big_fil_rev_8_21_14_0_10_47_16 TaxID=1974608 RepID=A0A2H0UGM0_9BACT|nr:hypothetical protein [Candidatus Parcubacteria bacterium]PIR84826.1 MAG: hypothetical protein COU16_00355 [Candidatus Kaiserbacteria bacterium CG10_big_fil_rev_8_21_14_0_10_47_16]
MSFLNGTQTQKSDFYRFLYNPYTVTVVGVLIAAVISALFLLPNTSNKEIETIDSPGSIQTIDQIGNNTTITIQNNPPLPEPTLRYDATQPINISTGSGQFKTIFNAVISSSIPLTENIGIAHPSFCSAQELGGGPEIRDGITKFTSHFNIVCITAFPIESQVLNKPDLFTISNSV